jgi:hypothetical protein
MKDLFATRCKCSTIIEKLEIVQLLEAILRITLVSKCPKLIIPEVRTWETFSGRILRNAFLLCSAPENRKQGPRKNSRCFTLQNEPTPPKITHFIQDHVEINSLPYRKPASGKKRFGTELPNSCSIATKQKPVCMSPSRGNQFE